MPRKAVGLEAVQTAVSRKSSFIYSDLRENPPKHVQRTHRGRPDSSQTQTESSLTSSMSRLADRVTSFLTNHRIHQLLDSGAFRANPAPLARICAKTHRNLSRELTKNRRPPRGQTRSSLTSSKSKQAGRHGHSRPHHPPDSSHFWIPVVLAQIHSSTEEFAHKRFGIYSEAPPYRRLVSPVTPLKKDS